ncbi:MAG: APC family permease [Malacoplasma sp.]|nr:APC family permease [Malacoplasma sp.]
MNNQKFSEKQFVFFILNYIMGFGFIATISSVISTGYFGIIIFVLTSLITLSIALVFSRLGNIYSKEYGGSYLYAKKAFKNNFAFFQGWNQFIQGPILAATSPIFIASAIELITQDFTAILAVRISSIAIFIVLVLISTLGIKLSKKVIFVSSFIKWIILFIGLGIIIYLSFKDLEFTHNFNNVDNVGVFLIFSNVLSFMYAFGGIEDVSAMIADVKVKNFRKTLMISFAIILSLYFLVFIFLNGMASLEEVRNSNFAAIFKIVFGFTGVIIFAIGTLFNGIASKISISISSSRKIIPLAQDGYLPSFLYKQNKRGEYKNAILFGAFLTIISMVIFWLLPYLLNLENFFSSVIELGTMAFLIQYLLTLVTAIHLSRKKIISKIPLWEILIYLVGIIIIITTLIIYAVPPITGEKWTIQNTIVLASYVTFIGVGYLLYAIRKISKNNSNS